MTLDSGRGLILGEQYGELPTPAEASCADFERGGRVWWRRGAEGGDPVEDEGLAVGWPVADEEGDEDRGGFEEVEGFVEDGFEPGSWLHGFFHEGDDGWVTCCACKISSV